MYCFYLLRQSDRSWADGHRRKSRLWVCPWHSAGSGSRLLPDGDAHALCIGIDLSAFVIIQVFGDIRLFELVVEVPVVIGHVILHGDELQELRVFLFVQLVDDVLV